MDISRIGGFRYTVNNIKLHTSVNNATSNISEKIFVNDKIEAIEPGCLKAVDEKKKVYESYISEYSMGITNGGCSYSSLTLEGMFKYSAEQYAKIENSTDAEETKAMKRVALESVLKNVTRIFVGDNLRHSYKLAPPANIEKDMGTMAEVRVFKGNQYDAIINSVKKITLNFLDFIKKTGALI